MKDYKNKHIGIILLCAGFIICCFTSIPTIISAVFISFAGSAMYDSGKGDELTELNIAKANKIVMILLIIAFVVLGFLGDDSCIVKIHENAFPIIAASALIVRSLLFLIFDRTKEEQI